MMVLDQPPLLLSVAPNGARLQKRDHPWVPLGADELALEAAACLEAGARLFHLHVRDAQGGHSLSGDLYADAIAAIRAATGDRLIVQITTEAAGIYRAEQQRELVLGLRPEAASIALREFVAGEADLAPFGAFLEQATELGVQLQFVLYDPFEVTQLRDLIARGIVPIARPHVLFVLGTRAKPAKRSYEMLPYLMAWANQGPWSICAFGPEELGIATMAIAMGGHARVGFENNILGRDGAPLTTNAHQVRVAAGMAYVLGRELATVEQARCMGVPEQSPPCPVSTP